MRRYAISIAVAGFFVLASVGIYCGVPPLVCGLRAAVGAAVLYVMTKIVGKVLLGIVVEAALRGRGTEEPASERTSE